MTALDTARQQYNTPGPRVAALHQYGLTVPAHGWGLGTTDRQLNPKPPVHAHMFRPQALEGKREGPKGFRA